MDNIKPLKWKTRLTYDNISIVEAEPQGLKYSYYISPKNNQYQLTFIEEIGQEEDNNHYATVDSAKIAAEKHYKSIVQNLLIA